jgi:hypothetical protein
MVDSRREEQRACAQGVHPESFAADRLGPDFIFVAANYHDRANHSLSAEAASGL